MLSRPFALWCALLAAASVYGQERTLACEIHPVSPALTFRLIYRAGYSVTVPMEQLMEAPRSLEVEARVTPKRGGGEPLVLKDSEALPAEAGAQERDASKFEAQVAGGFYVGEGEYHVELVVTGSGQRVCRKQWDIEVRPQKGASAALPPGKAAALSQIDLPRLGGGNGSVTIFLNASSARGNTVLLQSIAAILDRMPFRRVQVVAFSLDQHKELLREDVAGSAGFRRLAETVDEYNPATVSYGVLQDPAGHRDFLWKLLAKEGLRAPADDLVIFAGYATLDDSHVFVPPACTDGSQKPVYVYLEYALPGRVRSGLPPPGPGRRRMRGMLNAGAPPNVATMQPVMPDAISRVTRACSGKVFAIYSPADLAAALEKIEGKLDMSVERAR